MGVCTRDQLSWDQLPRDQLPCDQLLWDQLFMKLTLIKSTLSCMPKVDRYWCVNWHVDLFDRYWVVRFSVFKPLIFSTMHTHSHILQWLSSSLPAMEERTFISEGYTCIYTKIRDGANDFPILGMPKPQGWLPSKSHFKGKDYICKEGAWL